MKIVIGGSYHNPNWTEVKKVRNQLSEVGHDIIMPIDENPIDIKADFIKFNGEEEISEQALEQEFVRKVCEDADAFVIVNSGGYIGYATWLLR